MFNYTVIGDEKKLLAIGKLTKFGKLTLPYLVEWMSGNSMTNKGSSSLLSLPITCEFKRWLSFASFDATFRPQECLFHLSARNQFHFS